MILKLFATPTPTEETLAVRGPLFSTGSIQYSTVRTHDNCAGRCMRPFLAVYSSMRPLLAYNLIRRM